MAAYFKPVEGSGIEDTGIWTGYQADRWVKEHRSDHPKLNRSQVWDLYFETAFLDDLVEAIRSTPDWDGDLLNLLADEAGIDPDDYDDLDSLSMACEEALGITL